MKNLLLQDEDGQQYSIQVSEEIFIRAHTDPYFCGDVLRMALQNKKDNSSREPEQSGQPGPSSQSVQPGPSSQSVQPGPSSQSVQPGPSSQIIDSAESRAPARSESLDIEYEHDGNSRELRAHWTRAQVLNLINSYKKIHRQLDSSTIRNDVVWRKIAKDMGHHTGVEAMNKFKYLKNRYTKKKDSMGARKTGAKPVYFEFFDEFDEIFGKDPNIVPPSIASSLRTVTDENTTEENSTDEISASTPAIPQATNRKRQQNDSLLQYLKQRDEARERRHQQSLEALNKFNTLLEKFINKQP